MVERSREWRLENPEKVAEFKKNYYSKHKDYVNDKAKEWHLSNPEKVKAAKKKWKIDNPGANHALTIKRRCTKLNATPAWADLNTIKIMYEIAARVSKETGIKHHVDHIIPLQGKHVCGLHVDNNLQLLTAKQNIIKGNNLCL